MAELINIKLPSALFPFALNQLEQFQFGDYLLTNVFENVTPEVADACIHLWRRNRVIPTNDAARTRTKEVCYCITDQNSGKVIGVNTLYRAQLGPDSREFWLNRMFIDPAHRDTRLMIVGTAMMLCFAKTELEQRGLPGVVNINENRKLSRPGMQRIFSRLGYRPIGWQNGNEVILFRFADVTFTEAEPRSGTTPT